MARRWLEAAVLALLAGGLGTGPALAWERGTVENFATIPVFAPDGGACPNGAARCTSDIEGVAVGPDGAVYSASFGFNSAGALTGYGQFFVFAPDGSLRDSFPVVGSSPHLIGGIVQNARSVLFADLGLGVVWKIDPVSHQTTQFTAVPTVTTAPGLNALAIDRAGNVYVSDSFQGAIWKTGPDGGKPVAWYAPFNPGQGNLLLPTPNTGELLVPPFGANGIAFNNEGTVLYVLNTAYHSIVQIAVNPDGSAGKATTLTTGLNAPDGLAIDASDNLWVLANQEDEVVVVNPAGQVIAKRGDFDGLTPDGAIRGLLFPASPAFSPDGRTLYITNLALYLPYAGVPAIAVDSGWTLHVKRYNIARIAVGRCRVGGAGAFGAPDHPC